MANYILKASWIEASKETQIREEAGSLSNTRNMGEHEGIMHI